MNCCGDFERTASLKAAKHNKYLYLCVDILNISYQGRLRLSKHSQISLSSAAEETRKAALWSQDVFPLFEVYLTTICICFSQQSKWWFSLSTYHLPPHQSACYLLWNDTSQSGEPTGVGMIHGGRLWDTGRPFKILSTSCHSWWTTSRKLDSQQKKCYVQACFTNGESR